MKKDKSTNSKHSVFLAHSKVIIVKRVSSRLDKAIREGLCQCFPEDKKIFSKTRAWHGTLPTWSVIIECEGRIIAHVGVVDRVIKLASRKIRVAGIQNVFVVHDYRGQGLLKRIMDAAMKEAELLCFDCGLLFCIPELAEIYKKYGWIILPTSSIIRINEKGQEVPIPGKNITMYYPLLCKKISQTTIHLQGNDW